jgi:hypothetical protein
MKRRTTRRSGQRVAQRHPAAARRYSAVGRRPRSAGLYGWRGLCVCTSSPGRAASSRAFQKTLEVFWKELIASLQVDRQQQSPAGFGPACANLNPAGSLRVRFPLRPAAGAAPAAPADSFSHWHGDPCGRLTAASRRWARLPG